LSEQNKTPSDLIKEYASTKDGGELLAIFFEMNRALEKKLEEYRRSIEVEKRDI
jgi:hypothetical protein